MSFSFTEKNKKLTIKKLRDSTKQLGIMQPEKHLLFMWFDQRSECMFDLDQ